MPSSFAQRLIDWQRRHGRHDLPWQRTHDPYPVWLSEIMLQQTQVATVIPYFERFLARFPTLAALAAAPPEEVMALWSGLGYYARARNLHRCAQVIRDQHEGTFPRTPEALVRLPGIGRSTANAIAVACFGARAPILDGNVKRLLCRCFGIAGSGAALESRLWQDGERLLPQRNVAIYIQAQMDMGATVCTRTRPRCALCPVADLCVARREDRIAELPTPKPRRRVPEVVIRLLLIRSGERILFERRPASGIWGGLLSLPELPEGSDAAAYCWQRFGLRIGAVSPAPTFSHSLTHRKLLLQPLHTTIETAQPVPDGHWLGPTERAGAGLPAPIRTLISACP